MYKLNFSDYSSFSDLPLEEFNEAKFSIYVLDFQWRYLFVNDFVRHNLKVRGEDLIGKNMWKMFGELAMDSAFLQMKMNTEKGWSTNLITTSPLTSQRLNIVGQPMSDCYLFSASILPNKDELLNELRKYLPKEQD
jgi:hypothetical protein